MFNRSALLLIAAMSAFVIPFQAIINSRLGKLSGNPVFAAVVSFTGGTIALGIILLFWSRGIPKMPAGVRIPWYLYIGGLLGAVYVTTALTLVPKIGTANFIAATIVGQLVMSMVIDHFGLMGIEKNPISLTKVAGGALLICGMLLIQKN
jgi:transporter family-2 protein